MREPRINGNEETEEGKKKEKKKTYRANDAELVPGKFRHLAPIGQIPNADRGLVTAFARHQVLAIGRKSHRR